MCVCCCGLGVAFDLRKVTQFDVAYALLSASLCCANVAMVLVVAVAFGSFEAWVLLVLVTIVTGKQIGRAHV